MPEIEDFAGMDEAQDHRLPVPAGPRQLQASRKQEEQFAGRFALREGVVAGGEMAQGSGRGDGLPRARCEGCLLYTSRCV